MSIISFLEDTILDKGRWLQKAGLTSDQFNFLVKSRILRPTAEGAWTLTFVGIVILPTAILLCVPKFDAKITFSIFDIIKLLRSYFARSARRRAIEDSLRNPEFSDLEILREFDVLTGMIEWFNGHGIYRREYSRETSFGRPNWTRTLARISPVVTSDTVFYPRIVADRREGRTNDVSALQIAILARLMQRYGLEVSPAIHHALAEVAQVLEKFKWPLSDRERTYYLNRITVEQRVTFRTETLQILSLLRSVMETRGASSETPQVFGTTAFYSVWEDACRIAIARDLPVDQIAQVGEPTWYFPDKRGNKLFAKHNQLPDLMVRRRNVLMIVDAKYYYPFPISRPGGPDIVKQVYYAQSLSEPEENVRSIFLLPMPGSRRARFMGYANIEHAHRGFPLIEAWGIDPIELFYFYPQISSGRSDALADTIINGLSTVSEMVSQAPAHIRV